MTILVECRACHRKLKVQDEAEGKKIKCPNCAAVFRAIPSVTESGSRLGRPTAPPKTPPPKAAPKETRTTPLAQQELPPHSEPPAQKPPAPVVIIEEPVPPPPVIHTAEPLTPLPRKPKPPAPVEVPEVFAVESVAAKKAARQPEKIGPRKRPGTANAVGVFLVFGLFLVLFLGGTGYWLWTTYEKAGGMK